MTSSTVVLRLTTALKSMIETVLGGNAHGKAVELTLEFGNYQRDCFGRAGRRWDDVDRRRPRPSQVFMRLIQNYLVVGVAMNVL